MKKAGTKSLDLDDIGYIGIGRSLTEEESKLASEHIQAYKAMHPSSKRKSIKRGTADKLMRDAVKALPEKAKREAAQKGAKESAKQSPSKRKARSTERP